MPRGRKRNERIYTALECSRAMPPMRHKVGEDYDVMQSEVCEWLCSQPEIRQYVFDKARETGAIEYDPNSGVWYGSDY